MQQPSVSAVMDRPSTFSLSDLIPSKTPPGPVPSEKPQVCVLYDIGVDPDPCGGQGACWRKPLARHLGGDGVPCLLADPTTHHMRMRAFGRPRVSWEGKAAVIHSPMADSVSNFRTERAWGYSLVDGSETVSAGVPLARAPRVVKSWILYRSSDFNWGMGTRNVLFGGHAATMIAQLPFKRTAEFAIVGPDGTTEVLGGVAKAVEALLSPALPLLTFNDQYEINFVSLFRPLLRQWSEGLDGVVAGWAENWRAGLVWPLADPLVLQVLYRLAAGDHALNIADLPAGTRDAPGAALPACPDEERARAEGRWGATLTPLPWNGTGAHPPASVTLAEIQDALANLSPFVAGRDPGRGLPRRLTPLGERLIELLPPVCDDPDLPLRWRDPATGNIKGDAKPEIDDWTKDWFAAVAERLRRGAPTIRTLHAAGRPGDRS